MTLYELCNCVTLQSNIEIKIFDPELSEKESRFFRDQDDFSCMCTDCEDVEDYEVSFMYSRKSCDGTVWFVIEVVEP